MSKKVPVIGDGNGRVSKAQATRAVTFLVAAAALAHTMGLEIPWLTQLAEDPANLIIVVGGLIAAGQAAVGYFDRLNRRKETLDAVDAAEAKRRQELRDRLTRRSR